MSIMFFNREAEIEIVISKGYDTLSIEIMQAITNIISRQETAWLHLIKSYQGLKFVPCVILGDWAIKVILINWLYNLLIKLNCFCGKKRSHCETIREYRVVNGSHLWNSEVSDHQVFEAVIPVLIELTWQTSMYTQSSVSKFKNVSWKQQWKMRRKHNDFLKKMLLNFK